MVIRRLPALLLSATVSGVLLLPAAGSRGRAQTGTPPASNVRGKKLLRISQALNYHIPLAEVPDRVGLWQETGYDGLCFPLSIDPEVSEPAPNVGEAYQYRTTFRWWDVDRRSRDEFERDIATLQAVDDWGCLTDNFLWCASHVAGHSPPDWFNDEHWAIVTANARLLAGITREIGFAGIVFDMEGYGGGTYGVWRQPWDYSLYARSDYQINNEPAPHPFAEVAAQVRKRGRQWAAALTDSYPDITLFVIAGLYEVGWQRSRQFDKPLAETDSGLWPAFVDGLLEGLGPQAVLVSGSESTYLDSRYDAMLVHRDACLNQALTVSAVPELARRRITFAAGIWTDAGYSAGNRFSDTDVRVNQRSPERHLHAVHNALAASDRYAWQWGEWGDHGESNFMTATPTPLMREYWRANAKGHEPQPLDWEPIPNTDTRDYAPENAAARDKAAEFWRQQTEAGYESVLELPEFWKFRFDPEMKVRYSTWTSPPYDDSSWFALRVDRCWQAQGTRANGPGVYRVHFEVPAAVNTETHRTMLGFSALGQGEGHVYLNGAWIEFLQPLVDVSKNLKPGATNQMTVVCLNREGPAGLMGPVRLLARPRAAE